MNKKLVETTIEENSDGKNGAQQHY